MINNIFIAWLWCLEHSVQIYNPPGGSRPKAWTEWSRCRSRMYRAQSKPPLLLDPTVSPPSNVDNWLPSHHFSLLMHSGDLPAVRRFHTAAGVL
jgi:hypothetical protein